MVEHSRNVYKGIKGYMHRRSYKKLNNESSRTSRVELLGGSDSCKKRRLGWKFKLRKKLKLKFKLSSMSPKKILMSLRDGYVNLMNKIGNTNLVIGGGFSGGGGYGYGSNVVHGFGTRTLKEYDEKMIGEIYKSLVISQAHLVPCDVAKLGRQVISSREY